MKANNIGPRQLEVMRLLDKRGPLSPREAAAHLFPDVRGRGADGGAHAKGTGKGFTNEAGKANRGAGGVLGRMARAGWVEAVGGPRFHVQYALTDKGRAAMRDAETVLEEDPLVGPNDPVEEGRKRCTKCSRARPHAKYDRDSSSPTGYSRRCRFCHSEEQASLRAARLYARDTGAEWTRSSKETIVYRAFRLLRAVRQARRVGMWRGREGLAAYRELGAALDAFASGADLELVHAEQVDPHDDEPPHHADPRDADFDPKRHTTPRRFREAFTVVR